MSPVCIRVRHNNDFVVVAVLDIKFRSHTCPDRINDGVDLNKFYPINLERFSNLTGENNKIEHKNLIIDTESRQVYVDKQEVILTAREFSILELLMKNPHKVFTRANLF